MLERLYGIFLYLLGIIIFLFDVEWVQSRVELLLIFHSHYSFYIYICMFRVFLKTIIFSKNAVVVYFLIDSARYFFVFCSQIRCKMTE